MKNLSKLLFAATLATGASFAAAAAADTPRASVVSVAAWKSKPSRYVLTTADHMIQPQQQRDMARQIHAQVTELQTSHVPLQAQPARVADVILQAVRESE